MKTTSKKILGGVLAIVVIGAGAYLFDRYFLKNSVNTIIEKPAVDDLNSKSSNVPKPDIKTTTDKIVYLADKDNVRQVVIDDANGDAAKVLFTDKDEDLKIKAATDIAYLSREVLLFMGGDTSGKFFIVKLDGSQDKSVIDNTSKPSSFAISPDGQKIAYVIFSNVEASYGYNIIVMNRKGENRRVLFNTPEIINYLSFNEDGSELAFTKTDNSGKSAISKLSLDSPQEKVIYQGSSNIPTLSWSKTGEIVFSLADSKFTSSTLFEMDGGGGSLLKILDTKNGVASWPHLSSDLLSVGYLTASYQDKFTTDVTGDVKTSGPKGQNIIKIGSGIQILGFLP